MKLHHKARFLFLLLVVGCATSEPITTVTQTPVPAAAIDATQTTTPQPFTTTTPIVVIEDPFSHLTPTSVPSQIILPSEKVSILAPGPGSLITSPSRARGQAGPSRLDRIELRLIGEDGQEIMSSIVFLLNIPGNLGPYNSSFEFSTPLVAEAARLEIHNFSHVDGKLDHMASVDLTLLSIGTDRTYYTLHGPEKLVITSPDEFATIAGGQIVIEGAGWTDSDMPLKVEIRNSDDEVVGSADVHINSDQIGVAGTFEVTVPYTIDVPQRGRIALFEPSTTIPGMIHFTSIIVQLNP
jgi:hypothetical protein